MNSILRRLVLIVKVWLNALFASAEDLRQVFAAAYQRQRELLQKVRLAQAKVSGSKGQLQAKTADAERKLPQLEEQARRALLAGREDSARFALQLRQVAADELHNLEEQVRAVQEEEQVLALVEQRLTAEIEVFFARQEVLAARYSTAEAQVQINEALSGVSEEVSGLGQAMERAEQRTEDMQARVSVLDQLIEMGILETPGRAASELLQLKPGDDSSQAVEEKLEALRKELGEGS